MTVSIGLIRQLYDSKQSASLKICAFHRYDVYNMLIQCVAGLCRVATGQGKVMEIQGQGKVGILEFVMKILNFVESQGN